MTLTLPDCLESGYHDSDVICSHCMMYWAQRTMQHAHHRQCDNKHAHEGHLTTAASLDPTLTHTYCEGRKYCDPSFMEPTNG